MRCACMTTSVSGGLSLLGFRSRFFSYHSAMKGVKVKRQHNVRRANWLLERFPAAAAAPASSRSSASQVRGIGSTKGPTRGEMMMSSPRLTATTAVTATAGHSSVSTSFRRLRKEQEQSCLVSSSFRCNASTVATESSSSVGLDHKEESKTDHSATVWKAPLDFKFIRDNVEDVVSNCQARNAKSAKPELVVDLYQKYLTRNQDLAELQQLRNSNAKKLKKKMSKEERDVLIADGKKYKEQIAGLEQVVEEIEIELQREGQKIPNMTHPEVPVGGEECSTTLETVGSQESFAFETKDHLQIGEKLDLLDFESAANVSGSKFYYLRNEAALLELALIHYSMSKAVSKGFTPLITPDLVRTEVLEKCGFQPRAENTQNYSVVDSDLCLTGTAEIPLGGSVMNSLLEESALPMKLAGYGRCFRTEAGSAGQASKGLYRVHQFSKVEMFVVCTPEQSDQLHQELIDIEVEMFKELGLHFKVMDMASHDLGAPAYRKFDVEAWMPGMERYGEISSASNCTDYQARRLNIRYRPEMKPGEKKKPKNVFVHTLNATACAVPRMIVAILENFQQEDGSVLIPEVLQPYMFGIKQIGPPKKEEDTK